MYIKNIGIDPIETTSKNATIVFKKNKKIISSLSLKVNRDKRFLIIILI
tara:strand:- start:110 stop:256 length:147 start_codon:yes stop_codon:yes gene_type:complete